MKLALLVIVTSLVAVAQQPAAKSPLFSVSSPAFAAGAVIPEQYTCKGNDLSPPLQWSKVPAQTGSFALIVDDPDAPGGVWVHWVVWDLPATARSLPEAIPKRDLLDNGSRQGRNDFGRTGYNGPCPPGGKTHRYVFRLYALDGKLTLSPQSSRSDLDAAMKGHVVAETEYIGTFHR
jgi:Raf kinase inhibitor-like YbhB/YbcL family protein